MNQAASARTHMQAMEELSAQSSPVHRLHPLVKLLLTVFYIFLVVSFPKYDLSGILPMVLFPLFFYELAGISPTLCFSRLKLVLPLVLMVGIANPFLDKVPLFVLGSLTITTGMVSMVTLMLKGVFSLLASFLLMATTRVDALCASLRKIHVPELLVTLFLLTCRYISVILEQVEIMTDAYALRAPGQKGIHISAWGSFLGQLILRSMDRATELYHSMQLRGFDASYAYVRVTPLKGSDLLTLFFTTALFLLFRLVPVAEFLGRLFV